MAINSSTARADIFKEFRAVIKDNILNNVKVTNSFVDDVAVLPQVVISSPMLGRERNAFGTEPNSYIRDGELDIEIFASTTQTMTELVDEVESSIYNNLSELSVQNIEFGTSTPALIEVGGKMVKTYVIPVSFMFRR